MSTASGCVLDQSGPLASLYERHVEDVRRYVGRRSCDAELAEDVTQDVFVAVARRDDVADLGIGWLIRTAHNRLVDVYRRQDRDAAKVRALRPTPETDVIGRLADKLATESALSHLSAEQREVLLMHYVDGFTISEAADRLGQTPKSVEGLVTRARRNLRASLQNELGPVPA